MSRWPAFTLAAALWLSSPVAEARGAPDGSSAAAAGMPGAAVGVEQLARLAPAADPEVLALGLAAMRCAQAGGTGTGVSRLAVIDYSRSSRAPRLWVFDLAAQRLLFEELVAHGQGSGEDRPTRFSNCPQARLALGVANAGGAPR